MALNIDYVIYNVRIYSYICISRNIQPLFISYSLHTHTLAEDMRDDVNNH